MVHGDIDVAVLTLDIDRPPIGTVVRVGQGIAQIRSHLFEQVGPIHERQAQIGFRRERIPEINGTQQVGPHLRPELVLDAFTVNRVASEENRIGHLPAQGEGSAGVVDPALMVVGPGGDGESTLEMGRSGRRKLVLGCAEIGLALRADHTVRVRQGRGPLDRIVAVLGFINERIVFSL